MYIHISTFSYTTGSLPGTAVDHWGWMAGSGWGAHGGNQNWSLRGQTAHCCGSCGPKGVNGGDTNGQRKTAVDLHRED